MKLKKLIKLLNPNETIVIHILNKAGDWEKNKFCGKVKNVPYSLLNYYIINSIEDMGYAINFIMSEWGSAAIEILCYEPII